MRLVQPGGAPWSSLALSLSSWVRLCSLAFPGVPFGVPWRSLVSLVLPLTFPVAPWRAVTLLLGALQLEPRPLQFMLAFYNAKAVT